MSHIVFNSAVKDYKPGPEFWRTDLSPHASRELGADGAEFDNNADAILNQLNSESFCPLDQVCLTVPSFDKRGDGFSSSLYWRGPIWINVNYLLYKGLRHYGFHDYAERVKMSITRLTRKGGLYEYYDAETGEGHGAKDFSWTAALLLDLMYEEEGID